jgi:hypothetical protein
MKEAKFVGEMVTERGVKLLIWQAIRRPERGILMTDEVMGASQPILLDHKVWFVVCGCCIRPNGPDERVRIQSFIEEACNENGITTLVSTYSEYLERSCWQLRGLKLEDDK